MLYINMVLYIRYWWYIDMAATPAMAPPKKPAPAPNAKDLLPPPKRPPVLLKSELFKFDRFDS